MRGRRLLWRVPLAVAGIAIGVVALLVVAVTIILYVPAVRSAAIDKGIAIAREQTGMDISVEDLSLAIGHSPLAIYHAYRGKADLPLELRIDSLFVGHRGQDTLICVYTLRLKAILQTSDFQCQDISGLLSVPITVERLQLNEATFHSDSLIATVGVDVIVGHLAVTGSELNIAKGQYPLPGLRLSDVYVGIDLRPLPDPSPAPKEHAPLLLSFDVPDGEFRNIHFALTPPDLDISVRSLQANALVDVGGNTYEARRIAIGGTSVSVKDFHLPVDTLYGDACVALNTNRITSNGLHIRSDEIGAQADLSATEMDLEHMRVDVTGDAEFRGSRAQLRGYYAINEEAYAVHAEVEKVNLSPLLRDSTRVVIAGEIDAEGRGWNPHSRTMRSKVKMHLTDAIYDNIQVSGMRMEAELANRTVEGELYMPLTGSMPSLRYQAQTDHRFRVAEFMTPEQMQVDYRTQLREVKVHAADEDFYAQQMDLRFTTDTATSLHLKTDGLTAEMTAPMQVMRLIDRIQKFSDYRFRDTDWMSFSDLSYLDSLHRLIPDLTAHIRLTHGHPAQRLIERKGLDIREIDLAMHSDSTQTDLALDASTLPFMRLPAAQAALRIRMKEDSTHASLRAGSQLTDGALTLHGLRTDADLQLDVMRAGNELNGVGRLTMDSLSFGEMDLGSRAVNLSVARSDMYANGLRADVQLDDIPLEIADSILRMPDLDLHGVVRAQATIDGLPKRYDLSAEVLPLHVSARYKPYNIQLALGETPVVMNHNKVDFNGLPVYGADSTFLSMTGGLDLNNMRLDITLAADSFAPMKLVKDGPIPVYGELATDIQGSVTGPLDSIVADVDITILPTTDITYPIDKKNLAQVKPHGIVKVRYEQAADTLLLGGQVNVDDGFIRYSPKAYPIMPFRVDSGSHVAFNGPVGQTLLDVSASQRVKADVQSKEEETRRVDFTTGVRVNGVVDSIGIHSIGFFLEAPEDETITRELASLDEDTREGLAAALLATGMYMGESNEAAQQEGYALSSIINSRINAAMANSKMGKVVDVDISSGQTHHAVGQTNDMNIAISKSFFKDKLRITVGTSISDNPEVNETNGLLQSLTADYKLTKEGNVSLRLFSQRDYNNILEGELYKSGLGVRATKEWRTDTRTYNMTADAGVAYRSNNSIGPDVTLKSSMKNLLGHGETFTIKGNGAYYWALRNRHPGDPKKTDTYKFGVNTSLVFPYLHWAGDNNPEGDTRYMLGYQYENIAGGYGVHKLSGSFTYFIRSSRYITHAFTPFSLSVVLMKAESDSLLNKAAEYPQLIKLIASNEFVPSIGYNFIYNDYRSKRAVNTMLDLGVKESGNLINAIYCAFGHTWNELDKPLGSVTFNQFVKLTAELRNKFNLTDRVSIATRLFAGVNIPLGNSIAAPLSEAFYAGGPNSMRAASPYAYGPGNFYSEKYNQNFFHAGDVKLEANFELRFPIVWKLYGAAFVDAGNVWNWSSIKDRYDEQTYRETVEKMLIPEDLLDGITNNPDLLRQIALGTGAGLRLDLDGLVIRLDVGVGIHAPYQTYRYDKEGKPDKSRPITTYFNIPSALDALRLNFGIGYPF